MPSPVSRSRILVPLAALSVLVVGACGRASDGVPSNGDTSPVPTPDGVDVGIVEILDGRTFVSTTVTGRELVDRTVLRLGFDGASFSAYAGCNQMGGAWDDGGDRMIVGDGVYSTEMACEPALMEQDAWFVEFLVAGPSVDVDGDRLVLGVGPTVIEFLDRRVAEPDLSLRGTVWRVDTIITGETAAGGFGGAEATLVFGEDSVDVAAGCNSGGATVTYVDEQTVKFGPLGLTKMLCEPDRMALEAGVSAIFSTGEPVTVTIEADRLLLRSGDVGLGLAAVEP
jgi:heat shock protein HslJ